MIKHKKTLGVFIVLALLIVISLVFVDSIVQKTANFFLDPLNKDFSARLSGMDIDLTEGKANFSLKATERNTGRTVLEVKSIIADLNLTGLKVIINDADLTVSSKTLKMLQDQENDKSKVNRSQPLSLNFLSLFELNELKIKLPDAGIVSVINKTMFNFDAGYGLIQNISGEHTPSDLQFLTIPRVSINFGRDFFVKEKKGLSLTMQNPSFKINQELISALHDQIPEVKQAQTEGVENEKDKMSLLSMLERFQVQNLSLDLFGSQNLHTRIDQVQVDFLDGNGTINNFATRVTTESDPLVNVNTIKFSFDPSGLTDERNAEFKIDVKGSDINVIENAAKVVAGLPRMPPSEDIHKSNADLLSELSRITLEDTKVSLKKHGLRASIKKVKVYANRGKLIVRDVTGEIERNRQNFLKLNLITASLNPEQLKGPGTPELEVIVTDLHLKLNKALLSRFEKDKSSKKKPQNMPFSIKSILIGSSSIGLTDFPGIGSQKYLLINDFFGNIYNVNFEQGSPLGDFTFTANLDPETKMLANGNIDLAHDPYQWSINYKLLNFDMKKFNKELRARIPLTFKEGVFHFFGEALKQDNRIVGYYKPLLVDAEYAGDKSDYQGPGHFLAEGLATLSNLLFERSNSESVATKVPFVVQNGKMNVKVGEAVLKAIEHGLTETKKVKPRIDKQLHLKEAQEEK